MATTIQERKGLTGALGFSLTVILVIALLGARTAAAQCGPASGPQNTACGTNALLSNTSGSGNSAFGFDALNSNTTGGFNTADGFDALIGNTTGSGNTASGLDALAGVTAGNNNIGLGETAGANVATGSNNIEIGGAGTSDESNTIRIGTNGTQMATFIAGISDTTVTGATMEVSSSGQLGVASSSVRYKRDIRAMGRASTGLMQLRPVTFRYKNDPSATLQYGLVAEEVERVYPELVTYGAGGGVQTIRYLELTAMLLNELQKQAVQLRDQRAQLRSKDAELAAQRRRIEALEQQQARLDALSERVAALERQSPTAAGKLGTLGLLAQR